MSTKKSGPILQRFAACWGNGDFGRLGHGAECLSEETPRLVAALADMKISQVAAGGAHTAVLADDGSVWTMGLNDAGQLGHSPFDGHVPVPQEVILPEPMAAIAAGHFHCLALSRSGDLWSWGRNSSGQLGLGPAEGSGDQRIPRKVKALAGAGITHMAAGAEHSLACNSAGEVFTWGGTANGRLGQKHRSGWRFWERREPSPRLLRSLVGTRVVKVAAGHMNSGAIDEDGGVLMWGGGRFWQLGNGVADDLTAPQQIPALRDVKELALGGTHSMAVLNSGQLLVWGVNQNGLLGLGNKGDMHVRLPTLIKGLSCEQASAGWKHNAVVGGHGRMLSWGWGGSQGSQSFYEARKSSAGQLGLGNDFDFWQPTVVKQICRGPDAEQPIVQRAEDAELYDPPAWRVCQVSAGFNHTVAVIETAVE